MLAEVKIFHRRERRARRENHFEVFDIWKLTSTTKRSTSEIAAYAKNNVFAVLGGLGDLCGEFSSSSLTQLVRREVSSGDAVVPRQLVFVEEGPSITQPKRC